MKLNKLISYSIFALSFCIIGGFDNINAQTFEVDTILKNGSEDQFINFVYLGDGYTSGQQSLYINHVNTINENFFERVPYSNYRNFFNVFAIKVISPQTGVKHPLTAPDCPDASEFPVANPTNYFGTSFDLYDVHRLIYPTDMVAIDNVMIENFPTYDQILFIGNTTQYGGAGGAFAVGTAHPLSVEIMLHEAGHSFASLSDEYWAGDIYAAEKVNMTHVSNASVSTVKWQQWLDTDATGIYQHCCGGISANWYKPHTSCLMEFLEQEFCPVCRQRTIEKIYEIVNPIVSFIPSSTAIAVTEPVTFKLTELMLPIPNTLKIIWKLNGTTIASNVDTLFLNPGVLASGTNTLVAEVIDTNYMLRVAPTFTHHINKVIWTINGSPSNIEINGNSQDTDISIFPNPSADFINVKVKSNQLDNQEMSIRIIDIKGAIIRSFPAKVYNSELNQRINIQDIPAGNYYLNFSGNINWDPYKISIVR